MGVRFVAAALLLVGCGSPAPSDTTVDEREDATERDVSALAEPSPEAVEQEPEAIAECPADNPHCDPCYSVAPEVEARWPGGIDDAVTNAAARWWRFYVRGAEVDDCPLRIVAASEACEHACGGGGVVGLRVNDEAIVSESCSGRELLLVDVMTHELGHAWGLEHDDPDGGAMRRHSWCEPVVPSDQEIALANGCGDLGPLAGSYCPEESD